ncbi:MAG: TonB-dependent receptor, partial [Acidobacteriaceae bacterium]|nr:TonB-dependent receptor [Acidobacteriaceae bacterium]
KVFDYAQNTDGTLLPIMTLPKQQFSKTFQTGTVVKLNRVTFDADYYHVHFENSYSSTSDPDTNEPVYHLQPSSVSQGFEAESNINFSHGFSAYVNGSVGKATYVGTQDWVQNTPHDTEAFGVTYQGRGLDLGFFDKRVGTLYVDNGAYHNQATIDPFNTANMYLNYTVRTGGRFDQTKIRLSFNNLFDSHSITSVTPTGTAVANGNSFVTPVSGSDNISVLSGRSVMLSVQFGLSPKR